MSFCMSFENMLMSRLLVFVLISSASFAEAEIFSASFAAGLSSAFAGLFVGFDKVYCLFKECCDNERWMPTNFTDLSLTLREKIYGQHLVVGPVIKHLKGHVMSDPSKALVLSFHGWTGTGKNYVSKLVVEKMFKEGMKSKFVHLISATKEFPHEEYLSQYKDKLRQKIENAVRACPRSFFIFDEMDKMPVGLIDTIKPYLDYHDNLDGVDYRKATYFFLSNIAGHDIADRIITHWKNGEVRESITLKEMEEVIRLPAYNTETGLFKSEIVAKNLITAYLPFLPLERVHIKECIKDALLAKGHYKRRDQISEAKLQQIADELTYYPKGVDVFSTTGCKRIHEKVDLIMLNAHDEL